MTINNLVVGRHIIIHTDGACLGNPGPGGWGVILQSMDGALQLKRKEFSGHDPDTTNNRMEMTAAIKALEALKDGDHPVYVRSDSQYLVQGMNSWLEGWKARFWKTSDRKSVLNKDLWEQLDGLSTPRIRWEWVRGHADNELNVAVDSLATLAAKTLVNPTVLQTV
ncbi:ribonuclease HI [Phyllobacterium sp. A18/5-2]|uniref:ribonuclease HI n=1 Tax=Phyllobacterium sp. A18/5-2 TaxID=2978392 RepID=UPI0021C5D0C7|nr:ribonuclease HI [Phyllobacterium sp. A18/5-2]UXN65406.1 ribonuclease HI [Phyllobacterium sp. A18/5-2]